MLLRPQRPKVHRQRLRQPNLPAVNLYLLRLGLHEAVVANRSLLLLVAAPDRALPLKVAMMALAVVEAAASEARQAGPDLAVALPVVPLVVLLAEAVAVLPVAVALLVVAVLQTEGVNDARVDVVATVKNSRQWTCRPTQLRMLQSQPD